MRPIEVTNPDHGGPSGAARSVSKLALVAMPWSTMFRPSSALGALLPYVRRELPDLEAECFSEFITVACRLGAALYKAVSDNECEHGELLYMPMLYPEKRASVAKWFGELCDRWGLTMDWERVESLLTDHVDATAKRLVEEGFDVVGLTTAFGQLFPNLALATRIKALAPHVTVIIGGSSVSSRVGPSLLSVFPCLDYVVQGEGEQPLVALLRQLRDGRTTEAIAGVLDRRAGTQPARLSEATSLDALPFADFDEFAEKASEANLDWMLPIEASRGCWWDRVHRKGNPKATCYFCNLNVQWSGYREKSVARVAAELLYLSNRHDRVQINFVDNIMRHRGIEDLARRIARQRKEYGIFYEMRANVTPHQMLLLSEAGLNEAQFGIEGLSTAYLKRIGKGTKAIQNLQAMKLSAELGIDHRANLITHFPGSTDAEVEETRNNILRYALIYQPLYVVRFRLGMDNTVERLPQEFGIRNIRNHHFWRIGMPDDVWQRLDLMEKTFDEESPTDWDAVTQACEAWKRKRDLIGGSLLTYRDGSTFLHITDYRKAEPDDQQALVHTLSGLARSVYVACMEITSLESLEEQFPKDDLRSVLQQLIELDLLFTEDGQYLALATAATPQHAARRIRAAHRARRRPIGLAKGPQAAESLERDGRKVVALRLARTGG
jgi:ribosomal peptide maturation radical SAM protein 1